MSNSNQIILKMLQRHQRNNLDQLIAFARDELQKDFGTLKDNSSKNAHLSKTASLILDMYENLSYPLIGLQVIKENLTNIKHPHALQAEMILDKAELFYLQSVKHDLGKLKADQKIQHLSSEDIKQYIQQINWKLGFERESVLNQSQEIGDNIDLMKFFQGVRNFQNWQENLEKRTIEKLKKFANHAQNQLTLRKGFIVSKIQTNFMNFQRKIMQEAFKKIQNPIKVQKKMYILEKIAGKYLKQSFSLIKTLTGSKNITAKLQLIFKKGSTKIETLNLMNCFRKFIRLMKNSTNLFKILQKIGQKKILLYQFIFMRGININLRKKYEKIGRANEKMEKMSRRIGVKTIIKALSIRYYNLSRVLDNIYLNKILKGLNCIHEFVIQKNAMKSAVSQKIKGKILLSIERRENKPVNLRKTFLNWYLKSHEQNYSKKIYNIWLNGSISKFTFLMRIKNAINDGRKQKVKQELKYFLVVFMQNMNNYYKFCQKGIITKWLEWHRYCKKLMNLINLLSVKTKKIDDNIQKEAFKSFVETAKKMTYLQAYFRKRIQRMQNNFRSSFDIWRSLPNVKKVKGRAQLLSVLRKKLVQITVEQREAFEAFKYYKTEGKQKKVKFIVKIFTKDLVYLSSFFNVWRRNSFYQKMVGQQEETCLSINKQNALRAIAAEQKHLQSNIARQAVLKLISIAKFRKRRSDYAARTLKMFIDSSCLNQLKQTFAKFKLDFQEGRRKKNWLVSHLVEANKQKQSKILQIWNMGSKVKKIAERERKLECCFEKTNQVLKFNFKNIVNSRYVLLYLQKFYDNYRRNIISSIKNINNLPPRISRGKKKSVVDLADKLSFLVRKNQSQTYNSFKQNHVEGQSQKNKIVRSMVMKWTACLKAKFKLYSDNIKAIRKDQRHQKVINFFENYNKNLKTALDIIFIGESMKKKKSISLIKLNYRLLQKMRQTFKLWHGSAKSLTYLHFITLEKKRRVLNLLQKIHQKSSNKQAKRTISHFLKNSKIIQLQINFLRKLCDSQAGKVAKAITIWKGLPQPQNKQLITKASTFQRNLHRFATKIIRTVMNKFKDDLYFGNDKKKLAIRTLVARSCSGIQKYFAIWKKNNKLSLLFSQCHRLQSVMETILRVQQKEYLQLTDRSRLVNIKNSLDNIYKWWNKRGIRIFKVWRSNIEAIKKLNLQKSKNLASLADIHHTVQCRKLKKILLSWRKKIFLRNTISKTFVQNRVNNIRNAFLSIGNLPDFKKINKKKQKLQKVLIFSSLLENETRNDKIKVLQIFRNLKYVGNFKKLKSCQSYLKDKISQVHKILNLWLNMAKADKRQRRQASVENLFNLSELVTKSNCSQVFQSIKSTQLKRKCIEKLCIAMQIKKKGFLNIWRSKVKQIKINKYLDDSKKKSILQKINKLISGSSQENVKKTVRNFYLNFKISNIQVKFIQRLLQTKSGKVLEAFNKWKKIPNQNLMEKYKKGQKFFFKLEGLIKNKLAEVQQNFTRNSEQGNTLKKQSVLQLLQITSSGIRRYYSRWTRITKRDHTLKQANSMMHSLDAIQNCVAQSFKILFQNERNTRIKTWAIEKLILQTKDNTRIYYNKWRQITRQIKIAKELQKTEKTTALKLFANVLGGSQSTQIKAILEKFHKNAAISKISTNFLNRLLKTKSGKVVQLFQIWKSIPDAKVAKKKKKAIKFESNLNKMCGKFLRFGFQPFKSSSHEANNKKRICIQKLIRASMGQQKKKLLLWRQIIKQEKILSHTHLFDSIFEHVNEKVSNNVGIVMKQATLELQKKKNLCRKLILNASFTQHHSYFIWKEALHVDNIKIQKTQSKVTNCLINLINIHDKVQNKKMVHAISFFKKKLDLRKKIIEDVKKQQKNKKAILFFDKLSLFSHSKVGAFFYEALKNQNEMVFLNKNKSLQKSLESLNLILKDNLKIIIKSNRQTILMERALSRIFQNLKGSTQKAFHLWREYKNILLLQTRIKSEQKKNVLQILTRCLQDQQKIKVPYVISKFQKNYKSLKYRKQMLTRILQCKAGKVPLAFMIWKSLPNPGAKKLKIKAMKFQHGLVKLIMKNLKNTYQMYKNETQQGRNKKKNAVRKLILVTMSDSNRYFNKWRKASTQFKITQKVLALTRFFDSSVNVLRENVNLFEKIQEQLGKKKKCLQMLAVNTKINLLWVINSWRNTVLDQKCYRLEKIMGKFEPDSLTFIAIKEAFLKIKNKAEKQALKTYINSLWKWKMSNVEANYYSKFIKIFKESQELITLSNCLNKKHNQNLHWAFRKILIQGSDRYQRKYRITEKYLLRKISNYFQRFKINACFQQIKTWRNMYKTTIKGKKLIDLIEKFGRKQVYASYYKLQTKQISRKKAQQFIQKMNNFVYLLMVSAFQRVNLKASQNCCNKMEKILQKIIIRLKLQSFSQLATLSKIEKLQQTVNKTTSHSLMRLGLMKIQLKAALRVKAKLALILISCMEKQQKSLRVNRILNKFRKNSQTLSSLNKIFTFLSVRQKQNLRSFYTILHEGLEKKILLTRFKKGMAIKKILDQEDTKVLKRIFGLLKKRQNRWVLESIKKFVIRSNLKSSLAVSLWRLQMYERSLNERGSQ